MKTIPILSVAIIVAILSSCAPRYRGDEGVAEGTAKSITGETVSTVQAENERPEQYDPVQPRLAQMRGQADVLFASGKLVGIKGEPGAYEIYRKILETAPSDKYAIGQTRAIANLLLDDSKKSMRNYEDLRKKRLAGVNVYQELVAVLDEMIDCLEKVKNIYADTNLPESGPRIEELSELIQMYADFRTELTP